uniref:Uncharacterized protein n=1 Tax=Opuntia streptacantha TaxID=393608 RepID=A0A7C8YGV6_OPUST
MDFGLSHAYSWSFASTFYDTPMHHPPTNLHLSQLTSHHLTSAPMSVVSSTIGPPHSLLPIHFPSQLSLAVTSTVRPNFPLNETLCDLKKTLFLPTQSHSGLPPTLFTHFIFHQRKAKFSSFHCNSLMPSVLSAHTGIQLPVLYSSLYEIISFPTHSLLVASSITQIKAFNSSLLSKNRRL